MVQLLRGFGQRRGRAGHQDCLFPSDGFDRFDAITRHGSPRLSRFQRACAALRALTERLFRELGSAGLTPLLRALASQSDGGRVLFLAAFFILGGSASGAMVSRMCRGDLLVVGFFLRERFGMLYLWHA